MPELCGFHRQSDKLAAWSQRLRSGKTGAEWVVVQRAWDQTPLHVRSRPLCALVRTLVSILYDCVWDVLRSSLQFCQCDSGPIRHCPNLCVACERLQ